MAKLYINEKNKKGHINPELYGNFSEHLGSRLKGEFKHPLCKSIQLTGTIFRNITICAALKHTVMISHRLAVPHNNQLHVLCVYHTSTFPVSSVTDWI